LLGQCWAESFFKTIKLKCIHKHNFQSEKQAYFIIFDYIDGWYNTKRIHSALDGKAPVEALKLLTNEKLAA